MRLPNKKVRQRLIRDYASVVKTTIGMAIADYRLSSNDSLEVLNNITTEIEALRYTLLSATLPIEITPKDIPY